MIQNLLNSGGQQIAQQRAMQLQSYVNNFNPQTGTIQTPSKTAQEKVKSFKQVMESDYKSGFGSLLTKPVTTKVEAKISAFGENSKIEGTKPQLLSMISQISQKHGVDEKLVNAVIKQESGFNTKATSHCGAMGLMQLMPTTAKSLGVKDAYNPVENVEGGVKYLKSMLEKYNGNIILALSAYNAGPNAVDKYDGVPPYAETQNYVKKILADYLG